MDEDREVQINQLKQYQLNEIDKLQDELSQIDREINQLSVDIFQQNNAVSALRGIVSMRSKANVNNNKPKVKSKNRLWYHSTNGSIISRNMNNNSDSNDEYNLNICGMAYTPFQKRFEAPRQSLTAHASEATILYYGDNVNVTDLKKNEYLLLLYWLDRNDGEWRSFIKPPRFKKAQRTGLFSTRSPNRPSPLGLSLCKVVDICSGSKIIVDGVDILDETPLVQIFKYDLNTHSFHNIKAGWLDDRDSVQPLYYDQEDYISEEDNGNHDSQNFKLKIESIAIEKLEFIEKKSVIDIKQMLDISLRRKMKEISNSASNIERYENSFAVGAFRIQYRFDLQQNMIVIVDVLSGMRRKVCEEEADSDPEAALHLAFQNFLSKTS